MNSTTTRIATALAGTVAIIGAGWGAATASQPPADPCRAAVVQADKLVAQQADVIGTQAAYDIAVEDGMDKAPAILANLRDAQRVYVETLAAYETAAAGCR